VRLLVIENVGNLVCPAAFDLGEAFKAVMLSVAEGDDKPLKYPAIFARAEVTLLNKIDLLAHCPDFELERARGHALAVNPRLTFFELSCRSGQGIEPWLRWVEARLKPAPARVITV
jgi:hydrogenase nickel incorporation protein HypB